MSSQTQRTNRRTFLKRSAAALAAGPLILRSGLLHASPNAKVNFGAIGVGRRCRQLLGVPRDRAQIVAIADVYQGHLDELTATRTGKDWRTYRDYRELLAQPDIDAVIVATPDHWHALASIHACEAGKDVYVEKPMSLTIHEGQRMVEAARKHERVVQVGSQQRSDEKCRIGCELVRNGRLGEIHTVHGANYPSPWECDLPEEPLIDGLDWDTWCGQTEPRPYHRDLFLPRADGRKDAQGRPLGWISFRPYSGGEMTGWGAHGLDMIQWALGTEDTGPVEIWPEGEGLEAPVTMKYGSGITLKLDGKGDPGGALFEGDQGALWLARSKWRIESGSVNTEAPGPNEVQLPLSHSHMDNFIDCIHARQRPIADVAIGHKSTVLCHLGNIARWAGRTLRWDPQVERFLEDDAANAMLSREGRAPYNIA